VIEFEPGARSFKFEGADHGAVVSFFITNFARGQGPKLHRHPYEETFIVQAGEGTFTVGEETVVARAGQILVVPASTPHRFVGSGDDVLSVVSIHPVKRMVQENLEA
jgi:quercetin dioxygenase-like cupin family protein